MDPESVSPADEPIVLDFLHRAYGLSEGFFQRRYPSWWGPNGFDPDNILVLREKGEIVSLVRIFPMKMQLGNVRTRIAGIGNVATLPSYRGQGHMGALLRSAHDKMISDGFPLSFLCGDRHRYQNFGFENGGRVLKLSVSHRGISRVGDLPKVEPVRYLGQPDLLKLISSAYRKHPFHALRRPHEDALLYSRPNQLTYCAGDSEHDFGYLTLFGEHGGSEVGEFGGNPATVLAITQYIMQLFGKQRFEFPWPASEQPPKLLHEAANSWSWHLPGMVAVLNPISVLKAFQDCPESKLLPSADHISSLPLAEQSRTLFGNTTGPSLPLFWWPSDDI